MYCQIEHKTPEKTKPEAGPLSKLLGYRRKTQMKLWTEESGKEEYCVEM